MKQNQNFLALAILLVVAGCSDKKQGSADADESGHHADEKYAQKANCVNNLKMIGIAFKMWASDHNQKFPFQVSTNNGGSVELVLPDKDGFDNNAFIYLKNMTGELGLTTPLLLICPQDKSKRVAVGWTNLQPKNISYRFRSGIKVSPDNPREILAVCPIDGNILYCDGSVLGKNDKLPIELKPFLPFEVMTNSPSSPENLPKTNEHLLQLK